MRNMIRFRAFQGVRPVPHHAHQVACVPYDVINTEEARELVADNPYSLLRVDRAELELAEDVDPYSDAVYQRAVENFQKLQKEGILIRESEPAVYLYRQTMGSHTQTGIVGVCHVEDYEKDLIKKHEKTRRDKEDDRTRLVGDLSANTGPIFLTYKDEEALNKLIEAESALPALYNFTAPDGIRHTVWKVTSPEAFSKGFERVDCAYVADGHHRTASAARVAMERRAANPNHTGEEDYNWFLSVLFPGSQLKILPYNRIVADLNGLQPEEVIQEIRQHFNLYENASPLPTAPGSVSMYLDHAWYEIQFEPNEELDPVSKLDVSQLQDGILSPILGIEDPRTSSRIEFVGGIRGTEELTRKVDAGAGAIAFSLYPVTVDQLMDIADAGQIMPPKSTWFEPKLRSGLFVHTF